MKHRNFFMGLAVCAALPASAISPNAAGIYEISSAAELEEFAAVVNAGQNSASAILKADIDMDGVTHTPIGNSKAVVYKGYFNGNFHTITCLNMENPQGTNLALFGYVGAGAKICNTVIDDLSTFFGEDKCAAFVGQCCDSEEGVAEFVCLGSGAEVHAYSEDSGKGRAAGLVGPSDGNVAYRFENCYNTGTIYGATVGGIAVAAKKASCSGCFTTTSVKHKATEEASAKNPSPVGSIFIQGVEEFFGDWGWNFFFGGSVNKGSCYPDIYGSPQSWNQAKWDNTPAQENQQCAYKVFEDQWAPSGALCWYLNNCSVENPVWGQNLDEGDSYPSFLPGKKYVKRVESEFEFINLDDTLSGIAAASASNETPKGIYTIQGIRVDRADMPGLYIIDGKKVIVK